VAGEPCRGCAAPTTRMEELRPEVPVGATSVAMLLRREEHRG
jgi:hypothetical protein